MSGINMGQVKKNNRSQILRLINHAGPISKKDIAQELGLTPAAVTLICSEFLDNGLLLETGFFDGEKGKAGRKKVMIDINPSFGYVVGLNIDQTVTTISLCNIKGQLLLSKQINTDSSLAPEQFLKNISKEIKGLLAKKEEYKTRLLGVGVGLPGLVDKEKGVSIHAFGLWDEPVAVAPILAAALDTTVLIENNVNAFACAEILFGQGKEHDNMLLVKWGPGVGSALIIGGQLYEAGLGQTAELGHFIVEPGGKKCSCGKKGCLETVVSKKALEQQNENQRQASIEKLAVSLINANALFSPDAIVMYGSIVVDNQYFEKLLAGVEKLHNTLAANIKCSGLINMEDYVGPVAYFIDRVIL